MVYLDVSVEADGGVEGALQAFEGDRTLLLIVEEEDEDPAGEVQQHPHRGAFGDATVCPAAIEKEKSL